MITTFFELQKQNYVKMKLIKTMGGLEVKKFITKYGSWLASMALVVTAFTANSACIFFMHQDKLPESAKRLRRF